MKNVCRDPSFTGVLMQITARLTSTDHFEFAISLISLEHVFGLRDPHRKAPVGNWWLVQLL